MPKLTPIYDRVVIRRDEISKDKTVGGLHIPDMAKEIPYEGVVVAIGQGKYEDGQFRALFVKPDDRVLFGKYSGSEVTVGDEKLLIMREDEILGVLND